LLVSQRLLTEELSVVEPDNEDYDAVNRDYWSPRNPSREERAKRDQFAQIAKIIRLCDAGRLHEIGIVGEEAEAIRKELEFLRATPSAEH
jgi:hypothetical protein